jgi:tyrosinase
VTGFGGDGVPGTYTVPPDPANTSLILPFEFRGCVQDGPFADYTLKMGPGLLATEHCLTRGLNNSLSRYLTSSFVDNFMSLQTFDQFRVGLEGLVTPTLYFGPHLGGHSAVGGEMSNFFSSPGGE